MHGSLLIPHFTRAFLVRSLAAWVLVRLCMAGTGMLAAALARRPPPADPFAVTGGAAVLVVAMVAAVGVLSARLRNEDRFLINLGHGPARTVCASAILPVALELAARAARS